MADTRDYFAQENKKVPNPIHNEFIDKIEEEEDTLYHDQDHSQARPTDVQDSIGWRILMHFLDENGKSYIEIGKVISMDTTSEDNPRINVVFLNLDKEYKMSETDYL
jgi:hypothetical protein